MKFFGFCVTTLLLCIESICGQSLAPGGQASNSGGFSAEPDTNSEAVAVGALAFFSYLGLLGGRAVVDQLLFDLFAERLDDFEDCGTRNVTFLPSSQEPELTFSDCNWVDSCSQKFEKRNVSGENTTVYMDPIRYPSNMNCLDRYNIPGNGRYYESCLKSGISYYDCYILSKGVKDVSNTSVFTPQSEIDEIFSFCVYEQLNRGIAINTLVSSTLNRKCEASCMCTNGKICESLLGIGICPNATQAQAQKGTCKQTSTCGCTEKKQILKRRNKNNKKKVRQSRQTQDDFNFAYVNSKTPWLCSLKTDGFRGRHRCGVTLLSGPPKKTILVSAAHCSLLCKNSEDGPILEMCCCRKDTRFDGGSSSCTNTSSFCGKNGKNPQLYQAKPSDFKIVCGLFTQEEIPENLSPSPIVILSVDKISVHPEFRQGDPLAGNDIAVFSVSNPERLKKEYFKTKHIYPACLPRNYPNDYSTTVGQMTGWVDPEPTYRSAAKTLNEYVYKNMITQQYYFTAMDACKDPTYMMTNTTYPQGTLCYEDKSYLSCITFGNSGSPLVRMFNDSKNSSIKRFGFVGPLSLSKGCDLTSITKIQNKLNILTPVYTLRSSNPVVITDVRCYLDWIAREYGMKPPVWWVKPNNCAQATGDINDKDKAVCRSTAGTLCDFNQTTGGECQLATSEGYAYNIWRCNDTRGVESNCENNCKGVNANSIVVGGVAIGIAGAAASTSFLGPILSGTGAIGLAGVGVMANSNCLPGQCRPRGSATCCMLRLRSGRLACPSSC